MVVMMALTDVVAAVMAIDMTITVVTIVITAVATDPTVAMLDLQ